MSRFLDTRGNSTLGIALCQRCRFKKPLAALSTEPDTGLMVCADCKDGSDPSLLPQRGADQLTLSFVSPDTPLAEAGGFPPVEAVDP